MKKITIFKFLLLIIFSFNTFSQDTEKYVESKKAIINTDSTKIPVILYKGTNKFKMVLENKDILKEDEFNPNNNPFTLLWDGKGHSIEIYFFTSYSKFYFVKNYKYTNDSSIVFDCTKVPGIIDTIFSEDMAAIILTVDKGETMSLKK